MFAFAPLMGCSEPSPVQEYFAQAEYSFPLHVNPVEGFTSTLVCPGCYTPERAAPEYESLRRSGLTFVETALSFEYLQGLANDESQAFVVSDAYLFEDPPGSQVTLAVRLSSFKLAALEENEVYVPHERHLTASGEVLEIASILLLKPKGDGWEYRGWVY
jgi:hypothetical protein